MCIAIFKPRKTQPDWDAYETAYRQNDDGWGFAAARGGKLIVKKGVSSFNNFKKKFYEFRHCPAIVHFRIRTSGNIDNKNCHPFMISPDLAVIHNGILNLKCNVDQTMSDTWHFVRQVLRPMHESCPAFPWNLGISFLGEQFLGSGNKLVFLSARGEHTIWNSDLGHYAKDRHWYSNYSYCGYGISRFSGKPEEPKKTTYFSGWSSGASSLLDREIALDNQDTKKLTTADKISTPKKKEEKQEDSQQTLFNSEVSYLEDDPICRALGDCMASDYDAAQGLASAGLPMYVISELYKWYPQALENLYYQYISDWEEFEYDRVGADN